MLTFVSSFTVVALAEMGDRTQLIAFSLASRYRRPWTVMLGILIATVANHALAATVGVWVAAWLPDRLVRWVVGLGFVAFGLWTLVPDTAEDPAERPGWGPLVATTVTFFLVEMGDKTQLATVALGARFGAPLLVTAGTTLGMLAADGLAVAAATRFGRLASARPVRYAAAALFVLFGLATLIGLLSLGTGR